MPEIPTCAVLCIVNDSVEGTPVAGAKVEATLSSYEVYQGYVVPHKVVGTTDATGACTLDLWPNELGGVESNYIIKITALGKSLKTYAVIPHQPSCNLWEVAELPPYDGLDNGSLILGQVIAAMTAAQAARDGAIVAAGEAQGSATAAAGSATLAVNSANAAAASQTAAAASASAAASSQSGASNSATSANTSATNAAASQTAALGSKNLAQAWATQLVTPVEGGDYSAKYNALLAKSYADSIAGGPVYSVNGRTGSVTLTAADVGLANVANLSPANLPLSTAATNAFALKADLVGGTVPASQLPSYVDDVLEYDNLSVFPSVGEKGKIYVADDTDRIYRWSGASYIEISASPGSSDAVPEGSANLYFTVARVRATVLAGLSTATNAAITAADTVLSAFGKLQKQFSDLLVAAVVKTAVTGAARMPSGTTAERPANEDGLLRRNKTLGRWEGNDGTKWGSLGGASGGGSDSIFYESDSVMTSDYAVPVGRNAMAPGPLTIAAGVTLDIPAGSVVTII